MSIQQSGYYPVFSAPNEAAVQATGSTSARTLSDRFGETVKVADFGAVGDGIEDDTAAIQAAITYAISRGNAVIEFEPKTYNLVSTSGLTGGAYYPATTNRRHLEISGGTPETKLFIRGNGAKLYTDVNDLSSWGYIVAISSELFSLIFENITFERGPQTRSHVGLAIAMRAVSTSQIDTVRFSGSTFFNCMALHASAQGHSVSGCYRRLKTLEWLNCRHLHTRGCGTSRVDGGGQMINLSNWIDLFNADGVYVDGCVGEKFPNDVTFPVDGWILFSGNQTQISNSHFKNLWVEAIIVDGGEDYVANLNSFIQPAIGSPVTVTVRSNQQNLNEILEIGKNYKIKDGSGTSRLWATNATGVYRVDSAPSPLIVGSAITLTRMDDSLLWPRDAARTVNNIADGSTISFGRMSLFEDGGVQSATITNCSFVDSEEPLTREDGSTALNRITVTNGGSGYTSTPTVEISGGGTATATATVVDGVVTAITLSAGRHFYALQPTVTISGGGGSGATAVAYFFDYRITPAIMARVPTTVSNCFFDCYQAVHVNPTFGINRGGFNSITNNICYHRESRLSGVLPNEGSLNQLFSSHSLCCNNIFIYKKALQNFPALLTVRSGNLISGNVFYAFEEGGVGENTAAIGTSFTEAPSTGPWDSYIDNNYFSGFNYGVYGGSPISVGQMRGSFITAPVYFQVGSSNFKGSELFLISPNGTRYALSITNDREVQVRSL